MCYNKTYAQKTPTLGLLAVSRMGHDKGSLYAVVKVEDAEFVWCANGTTRTYDRPKKKRFKHLALQAVSPEIADCILRAGAVDDTVRHVLSLFEQDSLN